MSALDALLCALIAKQSHDDSPVVAAVHNVLGPVMNALALSEQRAYELREQKHTDSTPE